MTDESKEQNQWHLNKGVPIALILALFIQTLGAVWWASSIDQQVGEITTKLVQNEAENLRIWARINTAERSIETVSSILRTTEAILFRVEAQVKENNELLKEYLRGTNGK